MHPTAGPWSATSPRRPSPRGRRPWSGSGSTCSSRSCGGPITPPSTARISLGEGTVTEVAFGIRTVTVDPRKGLRINGEPVLLRGACIHSDNGPLGAAAIGRADERRIELLKQAGFNAIRTAHNPASPALLDARDRLGVMVMDGAFDMWTKFKTPYDYAAEFPQWGRRTSRRWWRRTATTRA